MTTPTPPDAPTTPAAAPPPPSRWRRVRPRGRGPVIAAVVLAVLVVGGVVAALLVPDGRDFREGRGEPGIGLTSGRSGPGAPDELGGLGLDGADVPDGLGAEGPAAGPRGDGPGRPGRGRGGIVQGRGLGDDTLLAGAVVATADGSIVLTPDGGTPRTIRTDDRTRVRGGGNTGLGDLQAGERVVVRVTGTGDAATAVAIVTPRARVTGTVTALTGDVATVTAVDGLTVGVNIAGLSQKPAVGDLVVLTGIAADGTTITADGVRVLPKAS